MLLLSLSTVCPALLLEDFLLFLLSNNRATGVLFTVQSLCKRSIIRSMTTHDERAKIHNLKGRKTHVNPPKTHQTPRRLLVLKLPPLAGPTELGDALIQHLTGR